MPFPAGVWCGLRSWVPRTRERYALSMALRGLSPSCRREGALGVRHLLVVWRRIDGRACDLSDVLKNFFTLHER